MITFATVMGYLKKKKKRGKPDFSPSNSFYCVAVLKKLALFFRENPLSDVDWHGRASSYHSSVTLLQTASLTFWVWYDLNTVHYRSN